MEKKKITLPEIVSREEWRKERKELLKEEKELTRKRDKLNAKRRRLPMVEIEKDYVFEGPDGKASLLDMFEGRRQLIVYHFMWLWEEGEPRDEGCPREPTRSPTDCWNICMHAIPLLYIYPAVHSQK